MKALLPSLLTSAVLVGIVVASPEDFVRDADEFRLGTHDRIHKPKVIYVDEDGTLLYPYAKNLVVGSKDEVKLILTHYPGELRARLELRIYIHPQARWTDIQGFVSWISKQEIGALSLRRAELTSDSAPPGKEPKKANKPEIATPRKASD